MDARIRLEDGMSVGGLSSDLAHAVRRADHIRVDDSARVVLVDVDRQWDDARLSSLEAAVKSDLILVGQWILDSDPPSSGTLADVIAKRRQQLSSIVVTCTGFPRVDTRRIAILARALSITVEPHYTRSITHVLVGKTGSAKHATAVDQGRPCVTVKWLEACMRTGDVAPCDAYSVPPLLGAVISISQLDIGDRERLFASIDEHGGVYTPDLSFNCTHLVAINASGNKYEFARKYGITIVRPSWVHAMIEGRGIVKNLKSHLLDGLPSSTPSQPAPPPSRLAETSILPDVIEMDFENDSYLSGCVVVLHGFEDERVFARLTKLLRTAGATRLDRIRTFTTHIVVSHGSSAPPAYHCAVVNVQWLVDCYNTKSRVPISSAHRVGSKATSAPAVPVRTSGLYLGGDDTATECLTTVGNGASVAAPSPVNFSQFNRSLIRQASSSSSKSQLTHLLFSGKNFSLEHSSLDSGEREEIRNDIIAHGGVVIHPDNAGGVRLHFTVARYIVAEPGCCMLFDDIVQAWDDGSRPILVTPGWLQGCIRDRVLRSPCDSLVYLPVPKKPKLKAFQGHGVSVSLSQFMDQERDLVALVVRRFGGRCSDDFSKKRTHLICQYPDRMTNPKQAMAVKHRIPIVHFAWLHDSVLAGHVMPAAPYEDLLNRTPVPAEKSVAPMQADRREPFPATPFSSTLVGSVSTVSKTILSPDFESVLSKTLASAAGDSWLAPKPKSPRKPLSIMSPFVARPKPVVVANSVNRFELAKQDSALMTQAAVPKTPAADNACSGDQGGDDDDDDEPVHVLPRRLSSSDTTTVTLSGMKRPLSSDTATPSDKRRIVPMNDSSGTSLTSYRFVISGPTGSARTSLEATIKRLGGELVDVSVEGVEACTHVVATKLSRVEKVMLGMLLGKWIVRPSMIERSDVVGFFVDSSLHDWADVEGEPLAQAIKHWRQTTTKPFAGQRALLCMASQSSVFESLLHAGGAETVEVRVADGDLDACSRTSHVYVDSKSTSSFSSLLSDADQHRVRCLSTDFIVETICSSATTPDTSYLMAAPSPKRAGHRAPARRSSRRR
ncbi:BRCT domain-containing protein [Plasmodiophora brassicae]